MACLDRWIPRTLILTAAEWEDRVGALEARLTIYLYAALVRRARRALPDSRGAWLALGALASLLLVACGAGTSAAMETANAAPDFQIKAFGNENFTKDELVSLSQFEGQPVVINFWFPSCPPCRLEMPDLEEASKRHKANGVQFIGVQLLGLDSVADGQEFIDDMEVTYLVGADMENKINLAYEVIGYPTSVFLSRDHQIVSSWAGALNAGKLEELIQELLQ